MAKHVAKEEAVNIIKHLPKKGVKRVNLQNREIFDEFMGFVREIVGNNENSPFTYQSSGAGPFVIDLSERLIAALKAKVLGNGRAKASSKSMPAREILPQEGRIIPLDECDFS